MAPITASGLNKSQWNPGNIIPGIPSSMGSLSNSGFGQNALFPTAARSDFIFPTIQDPSIFGRGAILWDPTRFTEILAGAIQHGHPKTEIEKYLTQQSNGNRENLKRNINGAFGGFPMMFYAVRRNDPQIIRLLIKYDADINVSYGIPPVPLLAFAIIHSKTIECHKTDTLVTLLSLGADVSAIPKAFYSPFDDDLPQGGPRDEDLGKMEEFKLQWCQCSEMRLKLTESLNLTQRYHLHRASRLEKPKSRQLQVARHNGSEDIFAIPYFMIGQAPAVQLLQNTLLQHMLMPRKQPLVLVFAGPSGHGKTELARRLGDLLSLELCVCDCTTVNQESELFGPRSEYMGSENGSLVNNFLARHNGQRCIVFLDEFEKSSRSIWNALLIPFDNGEYEDRRNRNQVDCTNTIWIIATNALDEDIVEYCGEHSGVINNEDSPERAEIFEGLAEVMQEEFKSYFSPPVAGRVSAFIPFIPFTTAETYVGTHKYILQLMADVSQPIVSTALTIGNVKLQIKLDVSVCKIAAKNYSPDLGIRSLKKAVKDYIEGALAREYLNTDEPMVEGGLVEEFTVFVAEKKIYVQRVGLAGPPEDHFNDAEL